MFQHSQGVGVGDTFRIVGGQAGVHLAGGRGVGIGEGLGVAADCVVDGCRSRRADDEALNITANELIRVVRDPQQEIV